MSYLDYIRNSFTASEHIWLPIAIIDKIFTKRIDLAKHYTDLTLFNDSTMYELQLVYQEHKLSLGSQQKYKFLVGSLEPEKYNMAIGELRTYIFAYRGENAEPQFRSNYEVLVHLTGLVIDILVQRYLENRIREADYGQYIK